jgi:phage tail-like protein
MPIVDVRSYVAGTFQLKLDGVESGFIKSVDGGAITAEVINEAIGPAPYVKKHVGPPRYEDFTMEIGLWMARAVYDWIQASLQMNYQRKNGSIVAYDYNLEARSEHEFFNALITEVSFPKLDGASKDQCYMTVKFSPELTRMKKAAGKATLPPVRASQEMWLASNFRLEIAGLDCTRVSAVESFTIKQTAVSDDIGDSRDYRKEPGRIEFPNLTITLAETGAQTWLDWFEDFVVKGNNGDDREKTGALIFLAPNRQSEIGRVHFFNMGIFKLAATKGDANQEQIRRVTAHLYCERMEFQIGKAAIA